MSNPNQQSGDQFDPNAVPLDPSLQEGGGKEGGILGAIPGQIGVAAQNAVQKGTDAVVNAGKGVLEMGGNLVSGLKRGFSKSGSESSSQPPQE